MTVTIGRRELLTAWRCGGRVAARGARAAVGDAGDRISSHTCRQISTLQGRTTTTADRRPGNLSSEMAAMPGHD